MKRLTHNTAYLAKTYRTRVQNYLGTSKGSIYVYLSDGLGILNELSSSGRRLLRRGRLIQKILSNVGLFIVLGRQINFDRDQEVVAFDSQIAIDCLAPSA